MPKNAFSENLAFFESLSRSKVVAIVTIIPLVLYALERDSVNAGLSWGAMVPIAGWFTTGAKFTNKIIKNHFKYSDEVASLVQQTYNKVDELGTTGKEIFTITKTGSFKDLSILFWDFSLQKRDEFSIRISVSSC